MGEFRILGKKINMADRLFTKRLNERILNTGLTASRWATVNCLMVHGELTQAEICEMLSIEASSVSKTLDLMERNGWIKRTPVPHDKREKLITLTDKAKAHIPSWLKIVNDLQEQLFEGLSEEEIDTFYRILDRICENLKKG